MKIKCWNCGTEGDGSYCHTCRIDLWMFPNPVPLQFNPLTWRNEPSKALTEYFVHAIRNDLPLP